MGRIRTDVLERAEDIGDRILVLGRALERRRVWGRVIDQLVGAGTSVGANLFEADEALSTKDWIKTVGIAIKELNETRYWLRRCIRQKWVKPERLSGLEAECETFKRLLGTMLIKTRRKLKNPS